MVINQARRQKRFLNKQTQPGKLWDLVANVRDDLLPYALFSRASNDPNTHSMLQGACFIVFLLNRKFSCLYDRQHREESCRNSQIMLKLLDGR